MYLPPSLTSNPSFPTYPSVFEPGTPPMSGAPVPFGGATQPGDGVGSQWWSCGNGPGGGSNGATSSLLSGLSSLLGSLISTLQQVLGGLSGNGSGSGYGNGNGYGAGTSGGNGAGYRFTGPLWRSDGGGGLDQPFDNVSISSTGDPHIAETGTTYSGQSVNEHYDDMQAEPDLVSANLAGGYRVATTVTSPNAKGVTYNQSASVTADHGRDLIAMQNDGSFTVSEDGRSIPLTRGQSVTLGGGVQVTDNANGSLNVGASDGHGGSISTNLSASGGGVNVTTTALGGSVVGHGH
jgi:hypothetical protein